MKSTRPIPTQGSKMTCAEDSAEHTIYLWAAPLKKAGE